MTVAEYESKLTQLARFATYVISTETWKARKFEVSLDDDIRNKIKVLKMPTYVGVVDRAYIAEKGIKASRSREMSQKKRFWKKGNIRSGVAPLKKVNTGSISSSNQGPTNPISGTIPNCPTCGTHWG